MALQWLRPFAGVYRIIISLRNWLFDKRLLRITLSSIPVVSIGNLSVGGEGKTPVVDWVTRFYQSKGKHVAIVSRGYGRKSKGPLIVCDGALIRVSANEAGDEPLLLARRNPHAIVCVAEMRGEGVQLIHQEFKHALPDVILLDDGFQHRYLARDLDIVVMNPNRSPFEDALLPAGRLREGVEGLRRSHLIVFSKVTRASRLQELSNLLKPFGKPIVHMGIVIQGLRSFETDALVPLGQGSFLYTGVLAFSGIGDPESFRESLEIAGLVIYEWRVFSDHHRYSDADIDELETEVIRKNINLLVTTEKDYYRLKANTTLFDRLRRMPVFYLEIEFQTIHNGEVLEDALMSVLT